MDEGNTESPKNEFKIMDSFLKYDFFGYLKAICIIWELFWEYIV